MRYASALCLVGLAACSGEVIQDLGTGGAGAGAATGSGGTTGTGGTGTTSATGGASAGGASTGGAPGSCGLCDPPGTNDTPAYTFHECTPPLEIGCPAQLCTPGATDCSPGYSCDPWGAAACCWCQAAVPACVFTGPAQGPLPEYLKLGQTSGPAGQALELRIEGFPFYVGALFYLARVGASGDLMQLGGSTCSFTVDVPGQP
ncbi:MAG: hypothetical protein IT374_28000, partial [Polyangiaceae bacterium]|nr:hypothetical protein [Polyangiaceae bacterium]